MLYRCGQYDRRWIGSLLLVVSLIAILVMHRTSTAAPALAEIKAAAEAGDAQAQDRLAEAYRHQNDHQSATFWYRKAAEQGIANSQFQLAQTLLYEATTPWIKVDSKQERAAEGVELLKRAAQQGHKRAQLHLGRLYQEGKVVPGDYVEAYKWFAIAGKGGALETSSIEGRLYRDRLVLKMSQDQIAVGEQHVRSFVPSSFPSAETTPPAYLKNLRLQGISGTPERRLAIINGSTFEQGEGMSVKAGSTWVYLTCQSITSNSALVLLQESGATVLLSFGKEAVFQPSSPALACSNPGVQATPPQTRPTPSAYKSPQATNWRPAVLTPDAIRKLVRVTAGVAVLMILLTVGFVAAVPRIRKSAARSRLPRNEIIPATVSHPQSVVRSETNPAQSRTVDDLKDRLRKIDWFQFEKVVEAVFRKQGYKVRRQGGARADGGVDLFVEKGARCSAVQCKHWKNTEVGLKPMREFVGALKDAEIEHGIHVALGGYTQPARELAARHGIELIEGGQLAAQLKTLDAGFDPEIIALLDDQNKFCPRCESPMVYRTTGKNGLPLANPFWGCSRYPRCGGVL